MEKIKTPCIGICSTTSLGDRICRGCKRYNFEVIAWNGYGEEEKAAVLKRIEKLVVQILENRVRIFSVPNLRLGLEQRQVPFDASLSPYCWLHNLLKKQHRQLESLREYGVIVLPDYEELTLSELTEQIERELQALCQAHFERYYADRFYPAVDASGSA